MSDTIQRLGVEDRRITPADLTPELSSAIWRESKQNLMSFLEHEGELFELHPGKIVVSYAGGKFRICDDSNEVIKFLDSLSGVQQVAAMQFRDMPSDVAWIL